MLVFTMAEEEEEVSRPWMGGKTDREWSQCCGRTRAGGMSNVTRLSSFYGHS